MMRSKLKRSKGHQHGNVPKTTRDKHKEVVDIPTKSDSSRVEALVSNGLQLQQQVAPIFLRTKTAACEAPKAHTEITEEDTLCDPRLRDLRADTFSVNQVFNILRRKGGLKGQNVAPKDNEDVKQGSSGQRSAADSGPSSCGVQNSRDSTPEKPHRPNRLSRTRRLRSGCGKSKDITEIDLQSPSIPAVYHRDNSPTILPNLQKDSEEPFSEDVLWTDKYRPVHSSEVIGNRAAVEQLHSWLKRWKLKTDIEERIKYEEMLNEEKSNDCWDCGDFVDEVDSGDGSKEPLCNTVLLTGPAGVGKTASVYACAVELGFKVFEVNCSSQRNGQEVLAQLKEATQSHLMETGSDPLKPAFFNSCNKVYRPFKSDAAAAKAFKKVKGSSSKTRPVPKKSSRKKKDNPVTLTSYFKTKAKADYLYNSEMSTEKLAPKRTDPAGSTDSKRCPTKKMATCLILFEEVDIIFEDDVGFLAAIKTLMTTTKRPVILTTTDPLFHKRFNSSLKEYFFQTPSMADVCSYLQLVCLAENIQLESDDVRALFKVTKGDVRRCLLQLQFWANSGGGHPTGQGHKRTFNFKGCTTNMLGLMSVAQTDLLQLLHEEPLTELQQTMAESWRYGFPILNSNLESILHIDGNEGLSEFVTSDPNGGKPFSKPIEISCGLYPTTLADKNKCRLGRRKNFASITTPCSRIRTTPKLQSSAAEKESNNLTALSDFFDLMSSMDASMSPTQHVVPCKLEEDVWTTAETINGHWDEMVDKDKKLEIILDIQATLETLGFRKAKKSSHFQDASLKSGPSALSETKNSCCITRHLSSPIVHQKRVYWNKKVLSIRYFNLLHNRRSVCTDYLPVIRFICRTHRKRQRTEELDWYVKSLRAELCLGRKTVQFLAAEFL